MTTIPGLIQQDAIEVVPDAVKLLQSAYNEVKQLLNSIEDSESAMNDVLLKHSLTSHNACNAVQLGLLYSSLCEPAFAAKAFKFLLLTTKDNLNLAVTEISRLLGEYWAKLLDTPRRQLLWLFHELVKSNTINAEHVLHHLLRRMTGGDLSPLNLWLVETVLDILSQHRHNWLDKKAVVPVVVYSYLRIIADHAAPVSHGLQGALERLRKREIDFVLPLLRDNFTDCLSIGRDLLRLLQVS
uniref:Ints3_N domain-containing protein n=1 Tax=Macrostomum lignano TaxID=282301 RepID=A0A1I8IJH0_9PLAT